MVRVILKNLVGSRAFGRQRPDSDYDYYNVYAAPVEQLLDGSLTPKSWDEISPDLTVNSQFHEAERVVAQLIKGNINDYMGVLGMPVDFSLEGKQLVDTLLNNLGKNIVHSTRGIMSGMHKKYLEFDHPEPKRVNLVCRVAKWSTGILNKGIPDWHAPLTTDPLDIPAYMDKLNEAYKNSSLPEKPDEAPYREWLLKLRVHEVNEKFISKHKLL